ncbi:hypothetical protein [Sphingobium sp. TomTYG45]
MAGDPGSLDPRGKKIDSHDIRQELLDPGPLGGVIMTMVCGTGCDGSQAFETVVPISWKLSSASGSRGRASRNDPDIAANIVHHCEGIAFFRSCPSFLACLRMPHRPLFHGRSGVGTACPRNGFAGFLPRPYGLPREARKPAPAVLRWRFGPGVHSAVPSPD